MAHGVQLLKGLIWMQYNYAITVYNPNLTNMIVDHSLTLVTDRWL